MLFLTKTDFFFFFCVLNKFFTKQFFSSRWSNKNTNRSITYDPSFFFSCYGRSSIIISPSSTFFSSRIFALQFFVFDSKRKKNILLILGLWAKKIKNSKKKPRWLTSQVNTQHSDQNLSIRASQLVSNFILCQKVTAEFFEFLRWGPNLLFQRARIKTPETAL